MKKRAPLPVMVDHYTEAQIQTAILKQWKQSMIPNTLIFAIPNQNAHGQAGLTKGVFDLCLIGNDAIMFLELKTCDRIVDDIKKKAGTLSEHQKEFLRILQYNKIDCGVAFGFKQALAICQKFGVIR